MRYFPIFIFSLLVHIAAAQSVPCPTQPAKVPIPTGATTQSPNRAALIAALSTPEMAAKKQLFIQKMAKLDADPTVQAQRKNNPKLIADSVNSPAFQLKKQEMANHAAVAQSGSAYQNQKAVFQANSKCIAP